MEQIGAGQFKAHCLRLMDQVQQSREEIVITKHGQPVAKLVPVVTDSKASIVGYMRDTVQVTGDIISPGEVVWEADAE